MGLINTNLDLIILDKMSCQQYLEAAGAYRYEKGPGFNRVMVTRNNRKPSTRNCPRLDG